VQHHARRRECHYDFDSCMPIGHAGKRARFVIPIISSQKHLSACSTFNSRILVRVRKRPSLLHPSERMTDGRSAIKYGTILQLSFPEEYYDILKMPRWFVVHLIISCSFLTRDTRHNVPYALDENFLQPPDFGVLVCRAASGIFITAILFVPQCVQPLFQCVSVRSCIN
jgi:hypothetical protein